MTYEIYKHKKHLKDSVCGIRTKGGVSYGTLRLTAIKTECGHLFFEINDDISEFCPYCGRYTGLEDNDEK